MLFNLESLAYILSYPPCSSSALVLLPSLFPQDSQQCILQIQTRIPCNIKLHESSCGIDNEGQRALISSPAYAGIAPVLGAYVEGEFLRWGWEPYVGLHFFFLPQFM